MAPTHKSSDTHELHWVYKVDHGLELIFFVEYPDWLNNIHIISRVVIAQLVRAYDS